MKTFIYTLLFVSVFSMLDAQDICNPYFDFMDGTEYLYASYNGKGKLTEKNSILVNKKIENGEVVYNMTMKNYDKDGVELSANEISAKCKDGVYTIDFQSILTNDMSSAYENMEVEATGDKINYPAKLEAGVSIPDANMTVSASMNGMNLMNISYTVRNHKVESAEKITVEGGTFDCLKLSYDVDINLVMVNTYHVESWITKEHGSIREIVYNKKGKMKSRKDLVSIKKQ